MMSGRMEEDKMKEDAMDVFNTISRTWPELLYNNRSDKERSEAQDALTAALNEVLHTETGRFLAEVAWRRSKHVNPFPAEYKIITASVLQRNMCNRNWVAIRMHINFPCDDLKGATNGITVWAVEAHADWFENETALKAEAEKYYRLRKEACCNQDKS